MDRPRLGWLTAVTTAAPGACPAPRRVEQHGQVRHVRCGRRSCESCGVLWLGDTRIRTLAACQTLTGAVALVTVTAPGRDVLPWDRSGARVLWCAAKRWNDSAPARWSALHRVAARAGRRAAVVAGDDFRLLVKSWEYQKRGVLHLHLLLPAGTPGELAAATAYTTALAEHATAHGFGFVDRGKLPTRGARRSSRRLEPVSPHRAAAYVAAYVASSGAGKGGVAEVARRQGVPGVILYVSPRLSRRSGVTMRSLRVRRRISCTWPDVTLTPETWRAGRVLDAMLRGKPPVSPGKRGALLARATAEGWGRTIDARTGETRRLSDAASPALLSGDGRSIHAPRTDALVRLDSVLHHGHHGAKAQLETEVVVVDTWTSPGGQGEETDRSRGRRPAPRERMRVFCPTF